MLVSLVECESTVGGSNAVDARRVFGREPFQTPEGQQGQVSAGRNVRPEGQVHHQEQLGRGGRGQGFAGPGQVSGGRPARVADESGPARLGDREADEEVGRRPAAEVADDRLPDEVAVGLARPHLQPAAAARLAQKRNGN